MYSTVKTLNALLRVKVKQLAANKVERLRLEDVVDKLEDALLLYDPNPDLEKRQKAHEELDEQIKLLKDAQLHHRILLKKIKEMRAMNLYSYRAAPKIWKGPLAGEQIAPRD